MPRFHCPVVLEFCAAIAVLSGCSGHVDGESELAASPTASANVAPLGAAPIVAPATLSTFEDQSVRARLIADDGDGNRLSYSIARAPEHAIVSLDGETGVYEL